MTERERILVTLHEFEGECSDDELRVIGSIHKRLETGRAQYGRLDLLQDARDWNRELAEELIDAMIYAAIVRLSGR